MLIFELEPDQNKIQETINAFKLMQWILMWGRGKYRFLTLYIATSDLKHIKE